MMWSVALVGIAIGQLSAAGEKITLAEGPLESMPEVVRASQQCGVEELSIEVSGGPARMYYNGGQLSGRPAEGLPCLAKWQRANANRLSLNPVWRRYEDGRF
ncbi:MAG: hypothetical protein EOO38_25370 [Cytophagaceae bacterium]|nr:MAG: hypothetical protein EOO38_25370 [Cytophagaceae bacterium]